MMTLIELFFSTLFVLGIIYLVYILLVYILLKSRRKLSLLRRIFSILYGFENYEGDDIIYQYGLAGCGYAVIRMAFNKLRVAGYQADLLEGSDWEPLTMLDMSELMKSVGITSKGFEYRDYWQFIQHVRQNSGYPFVLLLNNYDSVNDITYASVLLFPVQFLMEKIQHHFFPNNKVFHWVLLEKISDDGVYVADPFLGKIRIPLERFIHLWSRYGLMIEREVIA